MFPEDIFSYIVQQENDFESEEIQVGDNWLWNLRNHVQMIFHLKHGMFFTGENDWLRSFKNIMEPILTLAYWTEDLEVKDVTFFTENTNNRILSFLVKKYHDEVYVREHNLDDLFDDITESDVDFGGVLVEMTAKDRPKVLALTKIAFADQTDMMSGPIGFKLNLSPGKLKDMEKRGWGKEENGADGDIDTLIALAEFDKDPEGAREGDKQNVTTGKNIEVYVVRGGMPKHYLDDSDEMDKIENQLQIVAFYFDKTGKRNGFTLYRKNEKEGSLKFFTSQRIPGRGLGYGWGEKMLHPQIWTNFLEIHKTQMLESASKVPLVTDDETYTNVNQIQDMENLEVTTVKEGRYIKQVPTAASGNIQLYQNQIDQWFEHAQRVGAAFDPLVGKEPVSGTTFRGQERTVAQGRGPHDRLRGKRAKFIEEIYRDDILIKIRQEILRGKKFLASLTADEMNWVADQLATKHANSKIKERLQDFDKPMLQEEEKQQLISVFKENFFKTGNKKLIEILREDFEDVDIKMGINIAGKQKDLAGLSDKLLSIFQFVFANPQGFQQAMQTPGMSKAFNDILEFSGIDQTDFSSFMQQVPALTAPQPAPEGGGKPLTVGNAQAQ